jgi:bifunctional non-homologous end joining protein LigD
MDRFVLDRHEAIKRGLHFDLRFSQPNSKNWDSFSMNEIPPLESGKRIYIVKTTKHTEDNALFTGTIKSGYGAGKIIRLDKGNCNIIKYTNSHIVIDFKGKKLKGIYHFVNVGMFGRRKQYNKKVYSFFKGKIEK